MSTRENYPDGSAQTGQIARRHRIGMAWRYGFLAATIIGILALIALLYNIINSSFGLVAVQNDIDPDSLVLNLREREMLASENLVSSENDSELVEGVASTSNGVGFFGYAYYQQNSERLKLVPIEGVLPDANTASNGEYPLSRPLFVYTSQSILDQRPQVKEFLSFYVQQVNTVIDAVGYFPTTESAPEIFGDPPSPSTTEGDINISGSSTVFPLTVSLAEQFQGAGYAGDIAIDNTGSTAGLRALCVERSADIANASRPINSAELEACRTNGRFPVEIHGGADALAVVVHPDNDFVNNLTLEQLQVLFTTAQTWSDVNPDWPDSPISRYVPGADSGTLDFFTGSVFEETLADLDRVELATILRENISVGLGRRLERDQLFFEDTLVFDTPDAFNAACASDAPPAACRLEARSESNIVDLIIEWVIEPTIIETYSLVESLTRRPEILVEVQSAHPDAEVSFRSWLNADFVSSPQSSVPDNAGVRTAILGSLWVIAITVLFSFPIGVGAAIYLEEYATDNRLNRLIRTNINNLAGVPSIIYGMLGLAIFVRALEPLTSGQLFGGAASAATANGRTVISAGMTLGLLILPIIIINAQEAIRAVPSTLRQASYGLGATKWQTIWYHVLPNAFGGILTGTILSMSRAIGETAPLVVVGAATFITVDPNSPFSKFTTLPIQIYQWTSRPQDEYRNIAAAAILVLLVLLLTLNAAAIMLRNRYSRSTL